MTLIDLSHLSVSEVPPTQALARLLRPPALQSSTKSPSFARRRLFKITALAMLRGAADIYYDRTHVYIMLVGEARLARIKHHGDEICGRLPLVGAHSGLDHLYGKVARSLSVAACLLALLQVFLVEDPVASVSQTKSLFPKSYCHTAQTAALWRAIMCSPVMAHELSKQRSSIISTARDSKLRLARLETFQKLKS